MRKNKLLALGLAALMAASVAGCSTPSASVDDTKAAESGSDSSQSAAAGEKIFRYSNTADIATIDPDKTNSVADATVSYHIYDGLYRNVQGELQPATAESYEVSDDGLVYTFKLRQDTKWSDGQTVTAKGTEQLRIPFNLSPAFPRIIPLPAFIYDMIQNPATDNNNGCHHQHTFRPFLRKCALRRNRRSIELKGIFDFMRRSHRQCIRPDCKFFCQIQNRDRKMRICVLGTFILVFSIIYHHVIIIGTAPCDGYVCRSICHRQKSRTLDRSLSASSSHRYLDGIFTILQGKQRSSICLRRQRPPAAK